MIRAFRGIPIAYDNPIVLWAGAISIGIILGMGPLLIPLIDSRIVPIVFALMVFPFIALVIGSMERILVGAIILEIPFRLDKSFFHSLEAEFYSAVAGVNVSLTTLCLLILYSLWAARLLSKHKLSAAKDVTVLRNAPLLYVGIATASIVLANDKMLAFFEISLLWQAFLIMVYIAFNMRSRKDIEFILIMITVALFIQSMIMIFLMLTKSSVKIGTVTARFDARGSRVAGTVGSPNSTASYLTLILAPLLGLVISKVQRWYKPIVLVIFALGLISLLVTFSRGGWISFLISIAILVFIGWRQGWIPLQFVVFVGFVFLVVAMGFQTVILERIFGDDNNAAAGRVPLMVLGLEIIRDNVLFGVGANNYMTVWDPYLGPELTGIWLHVVHNKYMIVWAETGLIGIVAFVGFLLTLLAQCWRILQSKDPFLAPIALGYLGAISGQMIHMNFDLFTGRPQVQMLWLTAGIIAAMSAIVRREENQARNGHLPNPA